MAEGFGSGTVWSTAIKMDSGEPVSKMPRLEKTVKPASKSKAIWRTRARKHSDEIFKDFNWELTYNKRCPLVQYVKSSGYSQGCPTSIVKFMFKEDTGDTREEEFIFGTEVKALSFTRFISNLTSKTNRDVEFKLFDIKEIPYWAKVFEFASQLDLSVPRDSFVTTHGVSYLLYDDNHEETEVDEDQRNVMQLFSNAVDSDFLKGHANHFMQHLIGLLIRGLPENKNLRVVSPEIHYGATTWFEEVVTSEHFMAPRASSSAGSSNQESDDDLLSPITRRFMPVDKANRAHKKIPDVQVMLSGWPGIFPLVVEAKRSKDCELEGTAKQFEQMLTKFFFQDIIFGLYITPLSFVIQTMTKKESNASTGDANKEITLRKSKPVFLFREEDGSLDIDNLSKLFSFIYSVLHWSTKTRCLLHKEFDTV